MAETNGHCPKEGCYELRDAKEEILGELYPKINSKAEREDMEGKFEKLNNKLWALVTLLLMNLAGLVVALLKGKL